jgi:hypothetical protein
MGHRGNSLAMMRLGLTLLVLAVLLTIAFAFVHRHSALKRAELEALKQGQGPDPGSVQNPGETVADLDEAVDLALGSLSSDSYLFESLSPEDMPPGVEDIIIADETGKVIDSTESDLLDMLLAVPPKPQGLTSGQVGDPIPGEVEIDTIPTQTHSVPVIGSDQKLYWIVILEAGGNPEGQDVVAADWAS